jgi:glycogen operon protein
VLHVIARADNDSVIIEEKSFFHMKPELNAADYQVIPGRPYPSGPVVYDQGVRFTIFSRHAHRVWIALFDSVEAREPYWEYEFDPRRHRVGDMWSVFVSGVKEGAYFLYRMDGPWAPEKGHRFRSDVYLLDPYAKAFVGDIHQGTMKCVVVNDRMDWHDDRRPGIPMKDLVIYEAHVKGFTRHASSGVSAPGTYRGFIEQIPHLQALGVNAVELLPVQEFGETLLGSCSMQTGQELVNYWGYSNIGFFAPSCRYAAQANCFEHLDEFRELVRALHDAGMEIILDVVFNHTSEGDERGPTLSFKGIDNVVYYLLDHGSYLNYSGCGNTVNCNHPLVKDFILDCLRYWVAVMHIDGFRFDLASILGRDQQGNIREDAPLIARIAEDPVLRGTKLIAEAWDAGGAYQVGHFGGVRWAEWNGKYRDDVRRFWRGDAGQKGVFATRLLGSADLYQHNGRSPEHSINFITCHDGFTLHDLVSYNRKHNEANGEGNRDGADDNFSWNSGIEGETDDPAVLDLRRRAKKSLVATLFLSLGVPMMLGGDEMGRTQKGNNNAYCQDNGISWFDWSQLEANGEIFQFYKSMIAFRYENKALRRNRYYLGVSMVPHADTPDLAWYEADGSSADWHQEEGILACRIYPCENQGIGLYLCFNATNRPVRFVLPAGAWRLRIDSSACGGLDYFERATAPAVDQAVVEVSGKSVVVLESPVMGISR